MMGYGAAAQSFLQMWKYGLLDLLLPSEHNLRELEDLHDVVSAAVASAAVASAAVWCSQVLPCDFPLFQISFMHLFLLQCKHIDVYTFLYTHL